ncbi:YegP family protein [Pseudarthrobacter sp. S9]|uniref:YegP family protein n=1 Tax=Pseudarthrobacter sp. S9 TaxID=3418421 RepID=UPI003D076E32
MAGKTIVSAGHCNDARNWGGNGLAGIFEIAVAGDKGYFFRLTAADGTVVAVSPLFNTIKGAAAGITAVRENAATGLVVDHSGAGKKLSTNKPAPRMPVPLATSRLATG